MPYFCLSIYESFWRVDFGKEIPLRFLQDYVVFKITASTFSSEASLNSAQVFLLAKNVAICNVSTIDVHPRGLVHNNTYML